MPTSNLLGALRVPALLVLLLTGLAGCDQSQPRAQGAATCAAGHGRQAGPSGWSPTATSTSAASLRSTPSRCARACRAISMPCTSRTGSWSRRASFCSPSTAGRSRPRWRRPRRTSPRRRANLAYAESDLERGAGPGARQHHHAADLRPAHAGQAGGRGLRGGAGGSRAPGRRSTSSSPSCARRSRDASATGACRPATW